MKAQKRIVCLLGSGASAPFGIPTATQMFEGFKKELCTAIGNLAKNEIYNEVFASKLDLFLVLEKLEKELKKQKLDIEDLMRVWFTKVLRCMDPELLWRIAGPEIIACDGKVLWKDDGMLLGSFPYLGEELYRYIFNCCTLRQEKQKLLFEMLDIFFDDVLEGIQPIDVFTTNYDLNIETFCWKRKKSLYRGFKEHPKHENRLIIWNVKNFETAKGIRLYKLHGSIDWCYKYVGKFLKMRKIKKPQNFESLAIIPGHVKFLGGLFTKPFVNFLHFLNERLLEASVCVVVGFSFRDMHISTTIENAKALNKKLNIVLLDKSPRRILKRIYVNKVIKGSFGDKKSLEKLRCVIRKLV